MDKDNGNSLLLVMIVLVGGVFYTQAPHANPGAASDDAKAAEPPAAAVVDINDCSRDAATLLLEFLGTQAPEAARRPPNPPEVRESNRIVPNDADWTPTTTLYNVPPLLRLVPEQVDAASSPSDPQAMRVNTIRDVLKRDDTDVEFLIATIADPIDSRVGWQFDGQLSAIQRAIENAGHVPDRYFLPWKCDHGDKPVTAHRTLPGVFLFRAQTHLLVLFLVGETPTTGVHKAALTNALEFIAKWPGDRGKPIFHIVAPTFSGSVYSLRTVIRRWWEDHCTDQPASSICDFSIVSGVASGVWVAQALLTAPPHHRCGGHVWYHSVVIPEDARNRAFASYLDLLHGRSWLNDTSGKRHSDTLRVAMLQETGTAFGQGSKAQSTVPKGSGSQPPSLPSAVLPISVTADSTGVPTDTGVVECQPGPENRDQAPRYYCGNREDQNLLCNRGFPRNKPWLKLPFPLHISRVRSAHERLNHHQADAPQEVGGTRRPEIELSLDDSQSTMLAQDVVPAMAPSLTAASDELALSQILSTIAVEGFQYVGIRATDTRDTLFLARQIRKYAPDVQLFTLASDLLFTHPEYSNYLEGSLVLSTYPLFSANQHATLAAQPQRFLFSSERTEGVFNATTALLRDLEAHQCDETLNPLDYVTPDWPSRTAGGASSTGEMPPVWISVVGRGGLWPLAYFPLTTGAPGGNTPVSSSAGGSGRAGTPAPAVTTVASQGMVYAHRIVRTEDDAQCHANDAQSAGTKGTSDTSTAASSAAGDDTTLWTTDGWHLSDLVLLTIIALAIGQFVLYAAARARSERLDGELSGSQRVVNVFRPNACPACRRCQHLCVLASLYALLVMDAAFVGVYFGWWNGTQGLRRIIAWFGVLILVALLVRIGLELWEAWREAIVQRDPAATKPCIHAALPAISPRPRLEAALWRGAYLVSATVAVAISALVVWYIAGAFPKLLAQRALNFGSGVSPLAVLVFLGGGLYLAAIAHLRRLHIINLGMPGTPFETTAVAARSDLARLVQRVRYAAQSPLWCGSPGSLLAVALVLWVIPWFGLASRMLPTFEGAAADDLFKLVLFLYLGAVLLAFLQLIGLWAFLRRLLRRLATHPLLPAFSRLPSQAGVNGGRLWASLPGDGEQELANDQWTMLTNHMKRHHIDQELVEELPELRDVVASIEADPLTDPGNGNTPSAKVEERTALTPRVTRRGRLLGQILEAAWRASPLAAAVGSKPEEAQKLTDGQKDTLPLFTTWNVGNPTGMWLRLAEEHVALQMAFFLNQQLVQLRNLLGFITVAMLLLMLALNAYPFQPRGLLSFYTVTVFAMLLIASVTVVIQIDKDPVLSRIGGTTPNKLDRSILWPVLTYGVLPFLGLLATQFPEISGVASGAEQAFRVLR